MKQAYFFYLLAACFLFSCSENAGRKQERKDPGADLFLSQRFTIADSGSYKIMNVFSDKKSNDTTFTYVLYHKGSPRPKVNFKAMFVQTPVERVACLSSLYVGCLTMLGLADKIIAVDNKNYICNPTIRSKIDKGEIKEIAKSAETDVEQTFLLRPDLILTFGMGNPETDVNKKIIDAGIPVAVCIDHLETSPLKRASWLKFVAAFFEKESLADSLLKKMEKNYDSLKTLVSSVKTKPKVFTEIKYNDAWFVPGGKSFMAELLDDAGADYIWKDNEKSGSLPLSYEEVYSKAVNADYWINLETWNSLRDCEAQDERNKNFKAFRNGNLYNNNAITNAEGGNAYWETGLISPDEILADLVKIFHPELLPDHKLKYYKKLQ